MHSKVKYSLMEAISMIVKVKDGSRDTLLRTFELMPNIGVYRVKGNQIILSLGMDDMHVLARTVKEIHDMEGVLEVYPIFSKDELPL